MPLIHVSFFNIVTSVVAYAVYVIVNDLFNSI